MATTVYDINVRYRMDDKASTKLRKVGREAKVATRHTSELGSTLKRLAVGALGFASFGLAKRLLVDYNNEMQGAVIKMTTLSQMSMGGTWAKNQERANYLVRKFTDDAAKGVGTTKDYVDFAGDITKPFLDAGGSMRELTELTKAGVTAAKTFGIEGEVAGRDIQQMMLGTVKATDRLPKLLGVASAEWNKMVKSKGPAQTIQELMKVLNTPEIQRAAEEYGKSWDGVVSTLQDQIQRTFGKIGKPLMQAMSDEMVKWTKWFDKNEEKVNAFVKKTGEGLVSAFESVKATFAWIAENKDTLIFLAKAALVAKGVGLIGNTAAAVGHMVTGGMAAYTSAVKAIVGAKSAVVGFAGAASKAAQVMTLVTTLKWGSLSTGMQGMIKQFGKASVALAAGIIAIKAIEHVAHKRLEARTKQKANIGYLKDRLGDLARADLQRTKGGRSFFQNEDRETKFDANAAARLLREKNIVGKGGKINEREVAKQFGFREQFGTQEGRDKAHWSERQKIQEFETIISRIQTAMLIANQDKQMRDQEERTQHINGMIKAFQEDFRHRMTLNDDLGGILNSYFGEGGAMGFVKRKLFGSDIGDERGKGGKNKHTTNVKISRIEVVSDDPDRFAFDLVGAFKDRNINANQAKRAISEN